MEIISKTYLSLYYVIGFEGYAKYINSLDFETLCYECGVSKNDILDLATLYSHKYSTILLGYGMQKYKNGGKIIRIIDALGAITGQIGFSGGGINYANKLYTSVIDLDPFNSEKNAKNREYYVSDISEFIKESIDGKTYYNNNIFIKGENKDCYDKVVESYTPIKMAIIVKSNLLNQLPNLNKLKTAFSKIEFKVCFDMFMTDTAKNCDLIIPCTNTFESEDLIFSSMGNPYISYNEKIIEPKNNLMDEYYFFMELAKMMNLDEYPRISKREYLTKVIKPLEKFNKDVSLDYLKENPYTIQKNVPWEDKKFLTKSGKFEILEINDYIDSLENIENPCKNNYLRLLTNHCINSLSSQHFLHEKGLSIAYVNKEVSKKHNVYDKEVVTLKSRFGEINVKIKIDNSIGDDIIMMYIGWWERSGNPNYLTSSYISDIGGQIAYNETFVEIISK